MKKDSDKKKRSFELDKSPKRSFDLSKEAKHSFALGKDAESDLQELKEELLADGVIDKEEVQTLRTELYEDGVIDTEEANFLFDLNDVVSGKDNDPSWNELFVEAVSDYLLKDEKSPGEIDEDEAKWLINKIGADGKVDGVEKTLLENIANNAKAMPQSLTTFMASNGIAAKPQKPVFGGDNDGGSNDGSDGMDGSSKKWLWILLAIAIAVVVFVGIRQCPGMSTSNSETSASGTSSSSDTIEVNDTVAGEDTDSVANVAETDMVVNNVDSQTNNVSVSGKESSESTETKENNSTSTTPSNAPSKPTETLSVANPSPNGNVPEIPESLEEAVRNTIWGLYGNGNYRKNCLGDRYKEIQSAVNERYRKRLAR